MTTSGSLGRETSGVSTASRQEVRICNISLPHASNMRISYVGPVLPTRPGLRDVPEALPTRSPYIHATRTGRQTHSFSSSLRAWARAASSVSLTDGYVSSSS